MGHHALRQQPFRRRRRSFCQMREWRWTIAYMRAAGCDSTVVLPYWGRIAYEVSRPACYRRNHIRWHGRWERITGEEAE